MSIFSIGDVVADVRGRVGIVNSAPERAYGENWYKVRFIGPYPEDSLTLLGIDTLFSAEFDKHHCVTGFRVNGVIPYSEVVDHILTRNCGPTIMVERAKAANV